MYSQKTVLITGASSGLGASFAKDLASRGANLILVARREDILKDMAEDLGDRHAIAVHPLAFDLTKPDAGKLLYDAVQTKNLHVDYLINNAGFGLRGDFDTLDHDRQLEMIDLNARTLTDLCHRFGSDMIKRKSGGILNVASTAAFQPGPGMAVYYASKAFVLSLSEALHHEWKEKGIAVSCLCPGATKTAFADVANMHGTRLFDWFAGDIEPVVEAGLEGLADNRAVVIPGMTNKALAGSVRITPRPIIRRIVSMLQR